MRKEDLAKARVRQDEAKRTYDHQCSEFAEAETNYKDATKNVLEKAEAHERHMKTVTIQVETLEMTEDEFNWVLI